MWAGATASRFEQDLGKNDLVNLEQKGLGDNLGHKKRKLKHFEVQTSTFCCKTKKCGIAGAASGTTEPFSTESKEEGEKQKGWICGKGGEEGHCNKEV